MGCCLTRDVKNKGEKDRNDKEHYYITSTEGNIKENFAIDSSHVNTLLKKSYNSEDKLKGTINDKFFSSSQMTEEDDLPTFNYGGLRNEKIFNDKEEEIFSADNFENSVINDNSPTGEYVYTLETENGVDNKPRNSQIINTSAYFSINSTSILGNYFSKYSENKNENLFEEQGQNISNIFSKKSFIFLYFEINHFIFWARDYLISIYPEINPIMILEVNDSKFTQEKIVFIKSKEDVNKYVPLKKKVDLKSNSHRIIQAFELAENDKELPFKISISFYTYSNHKLLMICNDEIFLKVEKEGEMQKYTMYQNIYMKHYNKKVGNLMFNFAYMTNEIYPIKLEEEKIKILSKFYSLEKFSKFEEDTELVFIYNGVENFPIKENGNSDYSKQYFSIKDIEEIDIDCELKGEIRLDRLLELLTTVKKKFEFYQILKKINNYLNTKEFKEEKLINFKESLLKRLEEFSENKELTDKILLPYIFTVLKKAFFKYKNLNGGRGKNKLKGGIQKRKSEQNSMNSSYSSNSFSQCKVDYENLQIRNNELLISFFKTSFSFLQSNIQEDISLSALNYIYKYLEESFPMKISANKTTTTDEYFLESLIQNNYYNKLFDILLRYYEYQACVQPIFNIFVKILKNKKFQCQELINFFNTEKFIQILKKIIRIHDCNGLVMTNIFSTLLSLIDYIEMDKIQLIINFQRMKEIFNIYKCNGFDPIHETIINLIKGILNKRTDNVIKKSSKTNTSALQSRDGNFESVPWTRITIEEHADIIVIFSLTLNFLRNKMSMLDFPKLAKWIHTVLGHLYTISHIINNTNPKNLPKLINVIIDKKIVELVIECLSVINEKKIFSDIDKAYDILDLNLINIKIMIFRTLFHSIGLIRNLKNITPNVLTKQNAEKLIRILKNIEDHDINYSPNELLKTIERNTKDKIDQYVQNLFILHKTLQDYHTRFKNIFPETVKELIIFVKN